MAGTLSMLLVAPAIEHARSLGVDVTDVLARVGASSGQLDLEGRVDYDRALVGEVRHRLAVAQLEDTRLPITAIAFDLGFSDVSAFDRSFRRWTGKAPSAFRASAGSRAGTRSRGRRPSGRA